MHKKLLIRSADQDKKISILGHLIFGGISVTESQIISKLIHYSINNSLSLSGDISDEIRGHLSLTQSAFNTSMFRLNKKGVIVKSGKTITLHPIFSNLAELTHLTLDFT